MKKQLFIFSLLLLFAFSGRAQNTIAKIKYEEAEEAFDKENFALALEKIEETEKLLKNVNPKTLYLKIMAKYHLMKDDYAIIKSLKTDCKYYLDEYESNEGVQDKYREVYKISRELTVIGDSDEAIKKNNEKVSAEKIKKEKIKNLIFYANELCKKFQFKPGLDSNKFIEQNESIRKVNLEGHEIKDANGVQIFSYYEKHSSLAWKYLYETEFPGIITNADDVVINYSINYVYGKNKTDAHWAEFVAIKKGLYDQFEEKYIKDIKGSYYENISIEVPRSEKDDTIVLYINFSYCEQDKKYSRINISFSTN
jgi:hypothetical protein